MSDLDDLRNFCAQRITEHAQTFGSVQEIDLDDPIGWREPRLTAEARTELRIAETMRQVLHAARGDDAEMYVLRIVALVWREHPGFRDHWRQFGDPARTVTP